MSTLNQSPINNEEFIISLAEEVILKLKSLDSQPNSSSEANAKLLAQNTIKICHELLVQVDDVLKLQLGSLNGIPDQIDVTSQESIGPLTIDGGVEEIPSFSSIIQNRYRIKPISSRPIQPIQQKYNMQPTQQKTRLYIGKNTVSAIKEEVQALHFPTTLANIGPAIQRSENVLNAIEYDNDPIILRSKYMGRLTPTERLSIHKDEFRSVCSSLVSGGTTDKLKSWNEVEKKLSEVFLFFPLSNKSFELPVPLPILKLRHSSNNVGSCSVLRLHHQRRQRLCMYRRRLEKGSKRSFERFSQALASRPDLMADSVRSTAIKSYDEFAKDIDDQIKQNEEIERQDQIREE